MGYLAGLLGALATIGVPLFVVLAGLTMLGYLSTETEMVTLVIEMSGVASAPSLVAIPLFTFAGYLIAEAGTPKRLVRSAVRSVAAGHSLRDRGRQRFGRPVSRRVRTRTRLGVLHERLLVRSGASYSGSHRHSVFLR